MIIEKLWEMHDAEIRETNTENVLTMPSMESPTAVAFASSVTEGDVARRAFELYCDRGCEDGHDVDDWQNAERGWREAASSSAA